MNLLILLIVIQNVFLEIFGRFDLLVTPGVYIHIYDFHLFTTTKSSMIMCKIPSLLKNSRRYELQLRIFTALYFKLYFPPSRFELDL